MEQQWKLCRQGDSKISNTGWVGLYQTKCIKAHDTTQTFVCVWGPITLKEKKLGKEMRKKQSYLPCKNFNIVPKVIKTHQRVIKGS